MEGTTMKDSDGPKLEHPWYRIRLRTLLLFGIALSVGLGWLGIKVQPMRNELEAAAEIQNMGGGVTYGLSGRGDVRTRLQPEMGRTTDRWIRKLFGFHHAFANEVDLKETGVTDSDLALLKDLPHLEFLALDNTKITDDGLAHLAGLDNLLVLTLSGTQVTDAGMAHLEGLSELRQLNFAARTSGSHCRTARLVTNRCRRTRLAATSPRTHSI
jgi:hypothetical protein